MMTTEVVLPGIEGPALLRVPDDGRARFGVVALHPANAPARDQPLFEHLAATLTPLDYAVLTYDRRPSPAGGDVPFGFQATDALVAHAWLRTQYDVPVGFWAYSQGAWVAGIAAANREDIAFLALVGCPGVSPAQQMRYYTSELLRREGFDTTARDELLVLRTAMEELLRGNLDRHQAVELLAEYSGRPWLTLAGLPPEVPEELPTWTDMDFDPEPTYSGVRCPVLLVYGTDEECVPRRESLDAWRRAAQAAGNSDVSVVELPGLGHWPGQWGRRDLSSISTDYTRAISDWFSRTPARNANPDRRGIGPAQQIPSRQIRPVSDCPSVRR